MEREEEIALVDVLQNEYVLYQLRHGENPVTVYAFCESLQIEEADFYKHFNSFRALEASIWTRFLETALQPVLNDAEYETFTAHEKVLSFYYTIIEVFKQNRSFVVLKLSGLSGTDVRPKSLEPFRKRFFNWIDEVLQNGIEKEELAFRPMLSERYNEAVWVQFLYIIRVWINDESKDFEVTDAAIEKSSALLFELMKKGAVDLLIDFLKFAYQNKAY